MTPYVTASVRWDHGDGGNECVLYVRSANSRDDEQLVESQDPLYAGEDSGDENVGWNEEDGRYMRP